MSVILIIDDEKNIREGLAADFEMDGYDVRLAANGKEGLEIVRNGQIDLVITDLRMPGGVSGEEVLRQITTKMPGIPVIVLTGHGSIDAAVKAMQNGAYDFLTKPLNLEQLETIVKKALKNREESPEVKAAQKKIENDGNDGKNNDERSLSSKNDKKAGAQKSDYDPAKDFIGKSPAIEKVRALIKKVAVSKISVLITGETGTGKEVVANEIHRESNRAGKPFIPVVCSSLSETLLESELFGHEKGAFTDAVSEHKGKFELADGGTIFLDEIGEINPSVQVKLLRVLQERKFERVGGESPVEVDVRVIAATNKNLEEEVKAGRFREDLFFRLNGIQIEVPPLRERKDDISLFIDSFVGRYAKENGKQNIKVDEKARKAMVRYMWPGNIRELQHAVESAVVLCSDNEITLNDLPEKISSFNSSSDIMIPIGSTMEECEKIIIEETLAYCGGNKTKAADILKIGRKTLHRKIDEYGIE